VVGHHLLAVDRVQQLVAADAAIAVEHEVGEEQLPLGPGQRVLDALPIESRRIGRRAEFSCRPLAPSPEA
jgi:hypothetical protein